MGVWLHIHNPLVDHISHFCQEKGTFSRIFRKIVPLKPAKNTPKNFPFIFLAGT